MFQKTVTHRISRQTTASASAELDLMPTQERVRQGSIEQLPRPIADDAGRPTRPFRAVDILNIMERRGSITAGMREAAEDFRVRFTTAQLDPLRALDYSRTRNGAAKSAGRGSELGLQVEVAREQVWRAVVAVGGPRSPGGSCLWHVIGWERSIKGWALEQGWNGRRISQEAASGILISALGALEAHYRSGNKLRKSDFAIDKSGSNC